MRGSGGGVGQSPLLGANTFAFMKCQGRDKNYYNLFIEKLILKSESLLKFLPTPLLMICLSIFWPKFYI